MLCLAVLSYLNFMTKFFIPDYRLVLFVWSIIIFWKTKLYFQLNDHVSKCRCSNLTFACILIWIAENISTFYKIWLYPSQVDAWHMVGMGKLGSWYLLLLLSLVWF
jgi:uncharacterized membrane protein YoaT (DUF817 family)